MLVAAYAVAVKRGYPAGKFPGWPAVFRSLAAALPGLLIVGIILAGILSGVFTATESAAVAVTYTILLTFFIYRTMTLPNFLRAAAKAVKTTGVVLLLIGVSTMFQYLMGLYEVADFAGEMMSKVSTQPWVIFLLINVILFVLGTFMDMAATILICTPIFLPIAMKGGHGSGAVRYVDADQLRARAEHPAGRDDAVRGLRHRRHLGGRGDAHHPAVLRRPDRSSDVRDLRPRLLAVAAAPADGLQGIAAIQENLTVTDYRKLFDLTGKTAVVLGAASGIGKSSAEALAGLGARVVCADRAIDAAEATAAGIREKGGWAEAAACDAACAADVNALAKTVMQKFSRLDIAVTTPGLNIRKTILDYTEEDLDRVLNLNIKGTVWFFQAFGRIMVEQKGGSIIACSSVRAVTIEPGLGVYGSTKAAIGLLVKGFASEVGRSGVRVNAIAPSIAETALTGPFKQRPDIYNLYAGHTVFNRWSSADEVATAVAYLASDAASYVSGEHAVRRWRLDCRRRAADRPHPVAHVGRLPTR
ncbi:NAD(P)-dependent dehydrogenase (short-subunit alcohol dehydrogenase family) [Bradyrhizobium sp. GM5.1]